MQRTARLRLALALAFAGFATPAFGQTAAPAQSPPIAGNPQCDYQSVDSPPGQAWWAQQRWRYTSDAAAQAAYSALANGRSPWPDWFAGTQSTLAPGTRFQMAMAPDQTDEQPGGFGTFDNIRTVEDVRDHLAVLVDWKSKVDRVVTFEVINALPVQTGPIGPQVDPTLCRLLPGRWSQFQMLVAKDDRMSYLKVVEVRPIQ
jgi:hypothetical protein